MERPIISKYLNEDYLFIADNTGSIIKTNFSDPNAGGGAFAVPGQIFFYPSDLIQKTVDGYYISRCYELTSELSSGVGVPTTITAIPYVITYVKKE